MFLCNVGCEGNAGGKGSLRTPDARVVQERTRMRLVVVSYMEAI